MRYDIIEVNRDKYGNVVGNKEFHILHVFENKSEESIYIDKIVFKNDEKTFNKLYGDNPDYKEYISRNEASFPNEIINVFNFYCNKLEHSYGKPIHTIDDYILKEKTFSDGFVNISIIIRRLKSLEGFNTHMGAFND